MNMITKNMNNIKNSVVENVANIWIMKDTKEHKKALPNHALDKIKNPSRWLASL